MYSHKKRSVTLFLTLILISTILMSNVYTPLYASSIDSDVNGEKETRAVRTIYVLTHEMIEGESYIIVNTDAAGEDGYALSHSEDKVTTDMVTIHAASEDIYADDVFINGEDIDPESVWTYESIGYYKTEYNKLVNGNYALSPNGGTSFDQLVCRTISSIDAYNVSYYEGERYSAVRFTNGEPFRYLSFRNGKYSIAINPGSGYPTVKIIRIYKKVDIHKHTLIYHKAQPATCTDVGWNTYYTCSSCDYTTYVEIPALGHDYEDVVTDVTCIEQGYTTHTCSRCGDSYVDNYVEALGHDMELIVACIPSCDEDGCIRHYECRRCRKLFLDEGGESELNSEDVFEPAIGHMWSETGVVTLEATCTENGIMTFTCLNDSNHTRTEVIPASGHVPGEKQIENHINADCTTTENYDEVSYCTVCGDELSRENKNGESAFGHNIVLVPSKRATCEQDGNSKHYRCERCGTLFLDAQGNTEIESDSVVIPATGHTAGNAVQENYHAADCETEESYEEVVRCANCGKELSRETKTGEEALGHAWNEGVVTKEATCTEDGIKTYTCSRCSGTKTESLPKFGHDYIDVVISPTCTEQGYTTHTCSRCGDSYKDTPTAALDHDWSKPEYTWSEDNNSVTARAVCSRDSEHIAEETAQTTSTVIKEPTVTEEGQMLYEATFENETFVAQSKIVPIPKEATYEIIFKQFANTSQGIIVQWKAVEDPDLKDYTLYRSESGKNEWALVNEHFTETRIIDTAVTDLKSGSRYDYKVTVTKKSGNTYDGQRDGWYYLGVTTMNAPTCTKAGVRVTWPKVEGATKYVVMRSIGAGTPKWKYLTTVAATEDAEQTLNTKAGESGSWYAYTVRAVYTDENGNDIYGGQPAGRSILYRAPVKVVKADNIFSGVRVTFKTVKAGYTYRLYRSEFENGKWSAYEKVMDLVKTYTGEAQNVWIYDKTAESGKSYKYYVRCVSKDGKVPLSSYDNELWIRYVKPYGTGE